MAMTRRTKIPVRRLGKEKGDSIRQFPRSNVENVDESAMIQIISVDTAPVRPRGARCPLSDLLKGKRKKKKKPIRWPRSSSNGDCTCVHAYVVEDNTFLHRKSDRCGELVTGGVRSK